LSLPRSGRSLPMQLTASMPSLKTPRTETPPRRKTPQAAGLWSRDEEMQDLIKNWAAKQNDHPSLAAAVRRLVELGLKMKK